MPSGSEPAAADAIADVVWSALAGPTAMVRTRLPPDLLDRPGLLDDITAGLRQHFPHVVPVDVTRDGRRLSHAAVAPDGAGIAVETLLGRSGEVSCWVAPMTHYRGDLPAALRAAVLGSPDVHSALSTVDTDVVAVAEGFLATDASSVEFQRRGPLAYLAGAGEPVALPASTLPLWLLTEVGAGPRPAPRNGRLIVTTVDALDALLARPDADVATVRRCLRAPAEALSDEDATDLAALVTGPLTRWRLDWAHGQDLSQEPSDPQWSTAELRDTGRLDVLDGGPAGLWRILTDLPPDLVDEQPAVALVRCTTAAIWHELAALAADPAGH